MFENMCARARACVCVCARTASSRRGAVLAYPGSNGYVFWTVLLGDVTTLTAMDEAWHSAQALHAFMADAMLRSEDPDWEMMGFCPQGKVLTLAVGVVSSNVERKLRGGSHPARSQQK